MEQLSSSGEQIVVTPSTCLERGRVRGLRAWLVAASLVIFTVLIVLAGRTPQAGAGVTTSSTTTTAAPTTTTTRAPVTTTTQAAPTTTRPAPTTTRAPTSSTVAPSTTASTEPPSTSSQPATTAPAVLVPGTDDTTPRRTSSSSSSGGVSSQMKLVLIVGGLVAVGGLIGGLTFAYWRHTRPSHYLAALDVLAESSHGPDEGSLDAVLVGAGVGASSATAVVGGTSLADASTAGGSTGSVTGTSAGAGAGTALGAVAAARAASARQSSSEQAQAFRILGPVTEETPAVVPATEDKTDDPPPADDVSSDDVSSDDVSADDADASPDGGVPTSSEVRADATVTPEEAPLPIVTLEDLFGDLSPDPGSVAKSKPTEAPAPVDLWGDLAKPSEGTPADGG